MQKYSKYGGVSKTYICPRCGKEFLVPFQTRGGGKTTWVYQRHCKRKKIYYCSYHCFADTEEKEIDL